MDSLTDRLARLHGDYDKSRLQLELLQRRQVDVHDLMLRLSGAIQVLEELMAEAEPQLKSVEVAAEA